MKIKKFDSKVFVDYEQRRGWTGRLPFYMFWCFKCEDFSYDYPHGHLERQYLLCCHCSNWIDFSPWWIEFKILYQLLKYVLLGR